MKNKKYFFFVEAIRETEKGFLLIINDGTEEILDPNTLEIEDDNSITCLIKNKKKKALFTLSSYWQLVEHVIEENGKFFLTLGNKRWELKRKGGRV